MLGHVSLRNFSQRWRPYVWLEATSALSLAERGLLASLVNLAMVSPIDKAVCGGMMDLANVLHVGVGDLGRMLLDLKDKQLVDVEPGLPRGKIPSNLWIKISVKVMPCST